MLNRITPLNPAPINTLAALLENWKAISLDMGQSSSRVDFLTPAEMVAYLIPCLTDEDSGAGHFWAFVLLSGIPPLDLQGAEWDLYDDLSGEIELICGEDEGEDPAYRKYALSPPAISYLGHLSGDRSRFSLIFHRDGQIILLDELLSAFHRIAERSAVPALSVEDILTSHRHIAFNVALFNIDSQ